MKKHSKRYLYLKNLINNSEYTLDEAISKLKTSSNTKFLEAFEAHIKINLKNKNQQLKNTMILPHGNGKIINIGVIAEDSEFNKSSYLNEYKININNIINEIIIKKIDILITTPSFLPKLSKFIKNLNLKKLMPSFATGTVSVDLISTINEFKKGRIEYKSDKTGNIHLVFGNITFSELFLIENLKEIYKSILLTKPLGINKKYIDSFTICSTMSPGIKINLSNFNI